MQSLRKLNLYWINDMDEIRSKPIYDKNGKLLGNITGRKEDIEIFKNNDLVKQLESDRKKHKEMIEKNDR